MSEQGPPGEPEQGEQAPLLGEGPSLHRRERIAQRQTTLRATIYGILTLGFVVALFIVLFFWEKLGGYVGELPKDPDLAARRVLDNAPVIDGHIDLPDLVRVRYHNNASSIDLRQSTEGQVDIPRLREGKVGGFFWSVYADCPSSKAVGKDFLKASWRVRDTLEQIDIAKILINKYPDTFELALSSGDVTNAINRGRIASLLGVEGAHQLGNSIAVMRQYYALGVRYVTLTHFCNNAFADSCGYMDHIEPRWGGLSPLGRTLIKEMNRIGMLVDLSHTSDDTALQALKLTKAPVIWSHSSARAVTDVPRNVPDHILNLIGTTEGKTDGVIMVNFGPQFVSTNPSNATLLDVVDHIEHIAAVTGKNHVGLGSDFDGLPSTPKGLEDVSKYPNLIAELYKRGWNRFELAGLTGRNLLRVMSGAERVARELQLSGAVPAYDIYDKRTDL